MSLSIPRLPFSLNLYLLASLICILSDRAFADEECRGKLDFGPGYVHLRVLEFGKTVKKIDMPAVRGDATILIYKGLCLKPTVIYGSNESNLLAGQLGIGFCVPWKDFLFTPYAGCGYTKFNSFINLPMFDLFHAKENFRSTSPYIGIDATYDFCEKWRVGLSFQYAWSRTRIKINGIPFVKSRSEGPSYAALLEYDLTREWSVNIGAAYNLTLDKERHGLRGYGFKLGIARWFYSPGCGIL